MLGSLISASIGNNMENREEDVLRVKDTLSGRGLFDQTTPPEPHGYATRELDTGIKQFQSDNALKVDGIMHPGGETETALSGRANLIQGTRPVNHDATGRIIREDIFTPLAQKAQAEDTAEEEEDEPPIPPRKPEPPKEDDDTDADEPNPGDIGEEPDCSDLEIAVANAEQLLHREKDKKTEVEQDLSVKEAELERIENKIAEEKKDLSDIRAPVETVGAGAGAMTGGFVGGFIGRNPKTVLDGAASGATLGHDLAGHALKVFDINIAMLQKEKNKLQKEVEGLRSKLNEIQKRVVEYQKLLSDANNALRHCQEG